MSFKKLLHSAACRSNMLASRASASAADKPRAALVEHGVTPYLWAVVRSGHVGDVIEMQGARDCVFAEGAAHPSEVWMHRFFRDLGAQVSTDIGAGVLL